MARNFKQYTANIAIIINNTPVKAHLSIGMVHAEHPFDHLSSLIILPA